MSVDDAKHLHNSKYFGPENTGKFFQIYNDVWTERGGVQCHEDIFALAPETPIRNLNEVSANKRAMYRRRYELLQSLEERMQATLKECTKHDNYRACSLSA